MNNLKMDESTDNLLEYACEEHTGSAEFKEQLEIYTKSTSFVEKQTILKKLVELKNSPEEENYVVKMICHIYLWSSSKNPIKKTCFRLLLAMDHDIVKNCLAVLILHFIAKFECKTVELDVSKQVMRNNIVTMLQRLFGNPVGVEALNKIIDKVYVFALETFMQTCYYVGVEIISLELSLQMMYDAAKFLDALLHQCDTSIYLQACSSQLLMATYKSIRLEKIPFNTKAHCGALLVMSIVQCQDSLEQEELDSIAKLLNVPQLTPEDNLLTALLQSCGDCYTTRICVFAGIVHTCPLSVMSKYKVDDMPVAIFIFKKMMEIAMIRSSVAPEILEISRTLVSLSPLISNVSPDLLGDIMKSCWDYIWMHLDHFVDAVRSDAQKLLKTVITITLDLSASDQHKKGSNDNNSGAVANPYIQMFTNAIFEIIQGHNPNFKALTHIASTMRMKILLGIFPDLPKNLLISLGNSSVAQDVCVAYERLMEQHKKELPDTWIEHWVYPLLPLKQPEAELLYILRIFNVAFKLDSSVLPLIISSNVSEADYRAILGCIIWARKTNLRLDTILNKISDAEQQNNGTTVFLSFFCKDHLQKLICHQSPEIRILVLSLLVECQKSTEFFLANEFKLLISFFRFNSSSQLPHFRQNMLAMYKKAFNRFKESYYVIQRSIRNEEARGDAGDKEKLKELRTNEANYQDFVVTIFHEHFIRGLFTQVEYGKRALCLELMLHMKECLPNHLYNQLWYADYVQILFAAFNDTYETNLIMLRKLLLGLPETVVFQTNILQDLEQILLKPFAQVGYDIKSNVTTSATYAILVHIRSPHAVDLIRKAYKIKEEEIDKNLTPAMLVFNQLTKQITNQLSVFRKDVNLAAKYAPVHGVLFVIRHLIREEELDIKHPEIITNLVEQCLAIVELASPVVNSAAPEGYNPKNIDYEKADVTPQLVLHYAWRTIKEVSLLFGELRINHPEVKEVLLKDGTLEKISDYFIQLFESAKHRGAYEQGYVGFSKLIEKLWILDHGTWSKRPVQWLENALKLITSTDAKLCATRRSAGLPFMIQGILVTEPKHRSNKSFHYCMQHLLEVAQNYEESNQISAIHAMNILRALYRHNQLGEVVAQYVSQGVMISITQFSHIEWAIRNSATLMFSALMMRMFGVQRLKDCEEISIKNRLPLKVFKARYPHVYTFLFYKLEEFVTAENENVSLYPVLVILGRIYLTFDTKKGDELYDHLHILIKATTRTIFKIRELAVQATVTFESFLKNTHHSSINATNNQIHGFLLRLQHLHLHDSRGSQLSLNFFRPLFTLISDAGRGISQTCTTLFMDILIEYLISYKYRDEDFDILKELLKHLHEKQEVGCVSSCARFQQTRLTLYLHVILKMPRGVWYPKSFVAAALLQALSSRDENLNIYALNCIRYISTEGKLQEPESKELEFELVRSVTPQTKSLLSYIIRVHLIKRRTFMDLFDILRNRSRTYGLKVCQVLYNYPSIVYTIRPLAVPVKLSHQMILNYLHRQATCINSEMFVAILGLISKFVAGSNEPLDLEDFIDHIEVFAGDGSSVEERLAIANFLLKNYNLMTNMDELNEILRLKLWYIYLELIQDDEYVVREFCTQISTCILSTVNTTEVNNQDLMRNCPVIPERLHEDVLEQLPYFLGINEALMIYVRLSLQFEETYEYTDERTIYDKQRPHTYKESRQYAPQAKYFLATNLWKLDPGLSYADKSIFLEEHFLLVATKLINIIINQEDTDDRSLCVAVLVRFSKYLERLKIGCASTEHILNNFIAAFKTAETAQRAQNKTLCSCITEVNHFLSYVLFFKQVSENAPVVNVNGC